MKNCPYYDDEFCAFHHHFEGQSDKEFASAAKTAIQLGYNYLRGELTEDEFKILSLANITSALDILPEGVGAMFDMDAYKRLSGKLVEILGSENLSEILDEQKET